MQDIRTIKATNSFELALAQAQRDMITARASPQLRVALTGAVAVRLGQACEAMQDAAIADILR